ncbi:MAG: proprotein convertase P-domain-containing protein, partial [Bacillota bacterium]
MKKTCVLGGWTMVLAFISWVFVPWVPCAQEPDGWKEAALDRMVRIESEQASLRLKLASDPSLQEAQEALAALEEEWERLSMSMGGDRPMAQGQPEAVPDAVLSVPLLPPSSCLSTTTTHGGGTPVAIPTGPAVVTSTLVVAGAGTFIWDVNVSTHITHSFAADLDITLQSPAGTIVTLTTDNGAGNDNVFDGTVWDDSANPGGQVPYLANNGLVTDHTYVNLTLASPLVPEEAMGAF